MNENTKLTYHGAGKFIMGIPARNLSDYDLETVSRNLGITVNELVEMLQESSIYKRTDLYICAECGKVHKTWKAMSKHEQEHIIKASKMAEELIALEEETGEEDDNG